MVPVPFLSLAQFQTVRETPGPLPKAYPVPFLHKIETIPKLGWANTALEIMASYPLSNAIRFFPFEGLNWL